MKKTILALLGLLMSGGANAALKVGDKAPELSAPLSDGTTFVMKDWLAKGPLVLYFYPKDDTPGCTTEACALRDDADAFRNLKATVVGVSYDTVESHKKFIAKYKLPFPLIADTERTVSTAFGVAGVAFAQRATFIIGQDGTILYANPHVKAAKHSAEVRQALEAIKKN